nr:MAG TPA: protein of unknown function (DUF4508) [Inoviridae sp.]
MPFPLSLFACRIRLFSCSALLLCAVLVSLLFAL